MSIPPIHTSILIHPLRLSIYIYHRTSRPSLSRNRILSHRHHLPQYLFFLPSPSLRLPNHTTTIDLRVDNRLMWIFLHILYIVQHGPNKRTPSLFFFLTHQNRSIIFLLIFYYKFLKVLSNWVLHIRTQLYFLLRSFAISFIGRQFHHTSVFQLVTLACFCIVDFYFFLLAFKDAVNQIVFVLLISNFLVHLVSITFPSYILMTGLASSRYFFRFSLNIAFLPPFKGSPVNFRPPVGPFNIMERFLWLLVDDILLIEFHPFWGIYFIGL